MAGSYTNDIHMETRSLITRFRGAVLADLERQIRDTERRIRFTKIHRAELLSTKVGRAAQAKFMAELSKSQRPKSWPCGSRSRR